MVEEKVRIQLDFSPKAVQELDQMKAIMDLPSRAEVVRHALRWLRWTVLSLDEGGRLLIEKEGERRDIVLPFVKVKG